MYLSKKRFVFYKYFKEDANGSKAPENKLNKTVEVLTNSDYSNGSANHSTLNKTSRTTIKGTRWEAMDNEIDDNLGNRDIFFLKIKLCISKLNY